MPPTFAMCHPAFPLGFRRQRQKCWVKRRGGAARGTGLPAGGALEPPGPEAPPPTARKTWTRFRGSDKCTPDLLCRLRASTFSVSNFMLPENEINTEAHAHK